MAAFIPQANLARNRHLQAVTRLIFSYCAGLLTGNYGFNLRISLHMPCEYWGLTCSDTCRQELLIKWEIKLYILIHKSS